MTDDPIQKTVEALVHDVETLLAKRQQLAAQPGGFGSDVARKIRNRLKRQFVLVMTTTPCDPDDAGAPVRYIGPFGSYRDAIEWGEKHLAPVMVAFGVSELAAPR
jgi:hypothetical protein